LRLEKEEKPVNPKTWSRKKTRGKPPILLGGGLGGIGKKPMRRGNEGFRRIYFK